jgi:hypothetical protein
LFISGFSVFSGFSGLAISKLSPKSLKSQSGSWGTITNWATRGALNTLKPLMITWSLGRESRESV